MPKLWPRSAAAPVLKEPSWCHAKPAPWCGNLSTIDSSNGTIRSLYRSYPACRMRGLPYASRNGRDRHSGNLMRFSTGWPPGSRANT